MISHAHNLKNDTPVVIPAALFYILALQFCHGTTIIITKTDERPYILTARNADVAPTTANTTYVVLMNLLNNRNVLYMLTTNITCACPRRLNICMSFPSEGPK